MMPARITTLRRAIKYKNVADTSVPNTPPNCSKPECWCDTAP